MRTTNPMTLPAAFLATLGFAARRLTGLILAALCAVATALPVVAQDPATTQPKNITQDETTQIVSRPIPLRSVGLESGKVVRWTMRDAILAALEKNVDIELEQETVRLAQYDIGIQEGFYDPRTTSDFGYSRSISPNTFQFSGADAAATSINSNNTDYNFGISKNLERFGSLLEYNFNNSREASNANNRFSALYTPSMAINLTQPLFKNFKIDTNRRAVRFAKKSLDVSDAFFRSRVIEIISQVQQAYWNLALAIRNEEVARNAVTLAETQLNNNKRQLEVGTLAPIDVISAAASLENSRQQVFMRMNEVAQAENTLKGYTVGGPGDDLWNARIEPVESFEIKQPVDLPLTDAVKLAQENRPEIKWYALQTERNKIDIDFYHNQTKPQIDFIGSYGTSGVGGTPLIGPNCDPQSVIGGFCPGIFPVNMNGFLVQTIQADPNNPFNPNTASVGNTFIGGYGTSLSSLFKNNYRTWSVGLRFSFPLRNRTAQANLGKAKETERQLDLQTRKQLQTIELEVRNAVQAVETARMRSDAASAARDYAQKQYDGAVKRFQAGLVTTFEVLTQQNALVQAQFTETSALADYNIAVTELQRVVGTTLSSNNLEIKSPAQPVK